MMGMVFQAVASGAYKHALFQNRGSADFPARNARKPRPPAAPQALQQ
jgi:hypothetical protein